MDEMRFQKGVIAGRKKLEDGTLFPMVLLPATETVDHTIESFTNTIQQSQEWINNQLKRAGAMLFRGFPVKNASDFNAVVEAFGWEEQPYLGAASRTRIEGRVYTANEGPLHQPIHSHHEMSRYEDFPTKLAFYCEVAPPEGGQTAILWSPNITHRMEQKYPELITRLEKEGLMHSITLAQEDDPDDIRCGWQTHFQTKHKEEAEKKAAKSGYQIQWMEDGGLKLISGPHAAIRTFDGDKKAWFNLYIFHSPKDSVTLRDGSPVPAELIETCIHIVNDESVEVTWEVGDVLVLDNRLVQHARRPSKPPRRVLAALGK
eukprot:Gb_16265 [translate_table: standard]